MTELNDESIAARVAEIDIEWTYLESERHDLLVFKSDVNALDTAFALGLASGHTQGLEAFRHKELKLIEQVDRERLGDVDALVSLHSGAQGHDGSLAADSDGLGSGPAIALSHDLLRLRPCDLQAKRHGPIGNVVHDALDGEYVDLLWRMSRRCGDGSLGWWRRVRLSANSQENQSCEEQKLRHGDRRETGKRRLVDGSIEPGKCANLYVMEFCSALPIASHGLKTRPDKQFSRRNARSLN